MISNDHMYIYDANERIWEKDCRNAIDTKITQDVISMYGDYIDVLEQTLVYYDSPESRQSDQYKILKSKYTGAKSLKKSITDGKTQNVKKFLLAALADQEQIRIALGHGRAFWRDGGGQAGLLHFFSQSRGASLQGMSGLLFPDARGAGAHPG